MKRLLLAILALPLAAAAQEIVQVPSRPGVTIPVFIAGMGEAKAEAVGLMYSGGFGEIRLRMEGGQPKFQAGNFLVRTRAQFIRNGVQPILVDVPSDSKDGVSDPYRRSDAQVADARAVLGEARKRFPGLPIFIVTTSRSTLSAAHLAKALGPEEVAGVVMSSTMTVAGRQFESVSTLNGAKVPVLVVHHRDDTCGSTPYQGAARLAGDKHTLISVKGGDEPKSGPCEPFSRHGYIGKESPTVDAIAGWMLKKPFAKEIE